MRNRSVEGGNAVANISSLSLSNPPTSGSPAVLKSRQVITYNTPQAHNIQVGNTVSITGITGATGASVVNGLNQLVVGVPNNTSFCVYVPNTDPGTLVSASGVLATNLTFSTSSSSIAVASGGFGGVYSIQSAIGPTPTTAPYSIDLSLNISAAAVSPYPSDGSVSINLAWSSLGSANPTPTYSVTEKIGTGTPSSISSSSNASTTRTSLSAEVSYTYTVTATNAVGVVSTSVSIAVPAALSAPTSVTSSPTSGQALKVTTSWTGPYPASPSVGVYSIQRRSSTDNVNWGSWATVGTTAGGTTTYTDTVPSMSTYYQYQVNASNTYLTSGYVSATSTQPYYISDPMPTPTVSHVSTSSANIWVTTSGYVSNPAVTVWTIQRATSSGGSYSTIGTTASLPYTDTIASTQRNTTYYYKVLATNGQVVTGTASSASAGILTYDVPAAPTSVSAVNSTTSATAAIVSWTASTTNSPDVPVTNYVLETSTDNSTWSTANSAISSGSPFQYTATGLTTDTLYYFRMKAANGIGTSSASTATSTTPVRIAGTISTVTASGLTYNVARTISATTAAGRSVQFQYSADGVSSWTNIGSLVTATGGTASTAYTPATSGTIYLRANAAQDSLYSATTGTSASYTIAAAPLTISVVEATASYIEVAATSATGTLTINVKDSAGANVQGATVQFYKSVYGNTTFSTAGTSVTTDSSGNASYAYTSSNALTESTAFAVTVTKTNYTSHDSRSKTPLYTIYCLSSAQSTATGYSYAHVGSTDGLRGSNNASGGTCDLFYFGYFDTSWDHQASGAWFSSINWAPIDQCYKTYSVNLAVSTGNASGSTHKMWIGYHQDTTIRGTYSAITGKAAQLTSYTLTDNTSPTIDLTSTIAGYMKAGSGVAIRGLLFGPDKSTTTDYGWIYGPNSSQPTLQPTLTVQYYKNPTYSIP